MKCPFLEEVVVRYCRAYPIRKMIPSTADESVCLSDEHKTCPTFREVARVDVETEEIPQVKAETVNAPAVKGTADYFPSYWSKICDVLNCPVCPYRFQCLGAERRWLREPVLIHGFAVMRDFYYAKWHTWLQIKDDKTVRVGLDDFSQKLLGNITGIDLPEKGTKIVPNEPICNIFTDGWGVDMLAPIEGEVIATNPNVLQEPSLLNSNPYKLGWLLEIKTKNIDKKVETMLKGEEAIIWLQNELDKLHEQVEEGV